jgi:DNA-binding LytR/AlgR family response regulator
MYAIIHFEKEQLIVSKPLKEFSYLESNGFFRTHRSFLVNTKKIKRFLSVYGSEVVLDNGCTVSVSRSAKEKFMRFMNE